MKRSVFMTGLVLVIGAGFIAANISRAEGGEKKKLLRVGVYDSRAIAMAYGNSEHWSKILKEKQAALEQAKKDGDTEKVKEIEAWGPAQQAQAHLKAFGTAPVHECFECVKDKIPQVAKAVGVDVIVSKWEFDYLAADADVVDVTMELAKLFEPSDRGWKSIKSLKKWKPYSHEELERLDKEHSCGEKSSSSAKDSTKEQLQQTFEAYMQACIQKDVDAMADVYDLEYIAVKWRKKVGNDSGQIREMIKGIVANKPDEFYQMCTQAEIQSVELTEKEFPGSLGKAQIADIAYKDWSWTFRETSKGWKLIEEGVSGDTFDKISNK